MEKWTYEDVVDLLKQDYCVHYKNRQKFLENDNEIDSDYEAAQCDYIIRTLSTITQKSLNEVGYELDEMLEGVFTFDPQDNPDLLREYKGQTFYAAQDIYYCDVKDLNGMFDEEDIDILDSEVLDINEYTGEVFIPKGTKMTCLGVDFNGWPVFDIHGFEFDFAGSAFKLKPQR